MAQKRLNLSQSRGSTQSVTTHAGYVDGKRLTYLEYAPDCNQDNCPLVDACKSSKKGKCLFVKNFLRNTYSDWVDPNNGLGDVLSQGQLNRVGIHLMPLYGQLIRFWIDSQGIKNSVYTDKQGRKHPQPHYKEMREIQRSINAELRDLKLDALWEKKFKDSARMMPGGMPVDLDQVKRDGRPGAYEEITSDD